MQKIPGPPPPKILIKENTSENGKPPKYISVDLNEDGVKDWVFFPVPISDACGSQGCNYPAYLNLGNNTYCETYAVTDKELNKNYSFIGSKRKCIY